MISRNMPPINLLDGINIEESAQACAFTYLAYFNDVAPSARQTASYSRAWGCDDIYYFNPPELTAPGFVVAIWSTPRLKRMLIAVEGTTVAGQILNIVSILGWSSRTSILGYVWSNFKAKADAIYALLLADPITGPLMLDPRCVITWTGHSLGAAIADINAVRQKTDRPAQHVRLIKFGAPQVGNSWYVDGTADLVVRRNWYCGRDPIHYFPSSRVVAVASLATSFGLDSRGRREATCYNVEQLNGTMTAEYNDLRTTVTLVHLVGSATQAMLPPNPWHDHLMGSYRLAFMSLTGNWNDACMYRMRFLEHNNENSWQTYFGGGARDWHLWNVLEATPPDAVDPPTAQVDEVVTEFGEGGGGSADWGQSTVEPAPLNRDPEPVVEQGGPAADWGTPVPANRIQLRRPRRPVPVVPS